MNPGLGSALNKWICCAVSATAALLSLSVSAASGPRGVVATVHPLATQAGVLALETGGNAIDAAVAAGLTLGVVNGQNSGIGGGCFMLIHLANGQNICIDGRETAPALASRDMFIRHGVADSSLSQTGPLACAVPGELAAFDFAVRHFGRKRLRDLLLPAADIAVKGFPVTDGQARLISSFAPSLLPPGRPLRAGDTLRQADLAKTYRQIASSGSDWFYHGPFALKLGAWMRKHGGIMTADDLAGYQIAQREAISTTYRGYEIVSFPPPSSGGVLVLEMLNVLEHFQLRQLDPATRWHVIAETMKLAFADRAFWLGDPSFADVPRGLISKEYAAVLAASINLRHTTPVTGHGTPSDWRTDLFKRHTTHFSTADADGNWVACTATINTSFGSKVVVPGTGVFLNNEMDDFSIQPGVPNYFGLVGGQANAIAPGKRPLSSMSPVIVLHDGHPIIALGAAGGPKIISSVLLELVDMLDLSMSPQEAVAAPRIHQQWSPDLLFVESTLPQNLISSLSQRGHRIALLNSFAVSQIVALTKDGGFTGAADPRDHGCVALAP